MENRERAAVRRFEPIAKAIGSGPRKGPREKGKPGVPKPEPGGVSERQTGFVFDAATPGAFEAAVRRALALKADAAAWQVLMRRGMAQDLSWAGPARDYLALYRQALQARATAPRGLGA